MSISTRITNTAKYSIECASAYRFEILFSILFVQVVAFSTQGLWVEDFWEHSAAVTEFMLHPITPRHPQLALSTAHPFLNPYTFLVAQVANFFHIDAITALSIVGVFNFCLFCYGLRAFVSSLIAANGLVGASTTNSITFYSLLFILFLWGGKPWPYSGFFSYQIIFTNLPYPSTLVGGLSLLGLALNAKRHNNHRYLCILVLVGITTFALLTHPLTAQFLLIGLTAQVFTPFIAQPIGCGYVRHVVSSFLKISLIFILSLLLATLWPYYPILELFQGAGKVYDISNGDMYFHLLTRVWPFFLLAPVTLWVLFQPQQRPLLLIFISTLLIYALGYLTTRYSFGRIISYTMLCMQVALAIVAFRLESWLQQKSSETVFTIRIVASLICMALAMPAIQGSISRLLTVTNSALSGRTISNQIIYKKYIALGNSIEQDSIVFANIQTSWLLPSFGAKVVAADHPLAFVKDAEQRRDDVEVFFAPQTTAEARKASLQKYHAKYLVLTKNLDTHWLEISSQFLNNPQNRVIFENETFLLIKLTTSSP